MVDWVHKQKLSNTPYVCMNAQQKLSNTTHSWMGSHCKLSNTTYGWMGAHSKLSNTPYEWMGAQLKSCTLHNVLFSTQRPEAGADREPFQAVWSGYGRQNPQQTAKREYKKRNVKKSILFFSRA